VLRNLLADVELTLGLAGCASFDDVGRDNLVDDCCISAQGVYRAAPSPSQKGDTSLSDRPEVEKDEKSSFGISPDPRKD
jgi:hypothetical protein